MVSISRCKRRNYKKLCSNFCLFVMTFPLHINVIVDSNYVVVNNAQLSGISHKVDLFLKMMQHYH